MQIQVVSSIGYAECISRQQKDLKSQRKSIQKSNSIAKVLRRYRDRQIASDTGIIAKHSSGLRILRQTQEGYLFFFNTKTEQAFKIKQQNKSSYFIACTFKSRIGYQTDYHKCIVTRDKEKGK